MIRGLSIEVIGAYNFFVLLTFLYLIVKYRQSYAALLIIFMFWAGLFGDMGKWVLNIYKIGLLGASLYIPIKYAINRELRNIKWTWIALFFFVVYASAVSLIIHDNSVSLVFAQMYKYVIPATLLPLMMKWSRNPKSLSFLNLLMGRILFIQIILNIIKLLLIGNSFEGLVGSITGVTGGGAGTTLPLLGLCWFALNTNLRIKDKKSVLFLAGLLFIGFMTGKRAIWVLFPTLFLLLGMFVAKQKYPKQIVSIIILFPLFLYVGLRLSPTLNPEKKIWGSFDPVYAWEYATDYSMGKEDVKGEREVGQGRIGANTLIWNRIITPNSNKSSANLFGLGIQYVFAADYDEYRNPDYYMGINSRGSLTGFAMFYLAFGLIGTILFLCYWLSVIHLIQYKRARWIIGGMGLFDFFFYNSTIFQIPALAVLFIFIVVYTNVIYCKTGRVYFLYNVLNNIQKKGNLIYSRNKYLK